MKAERLKLDYYDEVVRGEPAVTLEDIVKGMERQQNSPDTQRTSLAENLMPATEMLARDKLGDELPVKKLIIDWEKIRATSQYQEAKLRAD